MSGKEPEPTSFWTTAPGILTAIAALVTAVGGLITALALTGVFGSADGSGGVTSPDEASPAGSLTAPSPSSDGAASQAILLASFEQDKEGWEPDLTTGAAGTTTRVSDDPIVGAHSLEVDVTQAGWFGTRLDDSRDISGSRYVSANVETLGGETRANLAILLKVGHDFLWCQSGPDLSATGEVTLDLDAMRCAEGDKPVRRPSDLTQLTEVWLYLNPGSFRVDNVRAE